MRFVPALLAALLAGPACAQTISGKVYDQTGAVVSGARVVLLEDFNRITETKSAEDGEFSFRDLKPGTYQVQVKQPRFQIFQQLVPLGQGRNARVHAVLHVARVGTEIGISGDRVAGVEPRAGAVKAARPGGKVEGPKRLSGRMPAWPEAARRRGVSGAVVLYSIIRTDGSVGDITALESPDAGLESAAIEAYKTWKYDPMTLNGRPVECDQVLVFNFTYR